MTQLGDPDQRQRYREDARLHRLGGLRLPARRHVRFTTLAALANELHEAESRRELARVGAATPALSWCASPSSIP
jgi:hypothetical protein